MKSRLLKGISCLLACVMLLEATLLYFTKDVYSNENVIALKKETVKWIEDSQNEDGSWGKSLGIYNTAEVLKYTGKQNLSGDVREKAVRYLDTAYENNNDDLYRKNSINEITTEDKIKEIIKMCISSALMAITVIFVKKSVGGFLDTGLISNIIISACSVISGMAVYGICAIVLKINSMSFSIGIVSKILKRGGNS